MLRLFKVLREIKVYRDYLKIVKNESLNYPLWTRRNLRSDWVGRIYTVINLPPQVTQSPDLPREARPSFVVNEIKPINDYLKSLNLEEIITVGIKPVEGTTEESYLVVYQYVFKHLTMLWILRFIVEVVALTLISIKLYNYFI